MFLEEPDLNPLSIIYAILIFGVLIFIHELGHFIVARLCGVKVLEFAIGMGPKLFSWKGKRKGTVYSLRAFPIGGFVNMLGENGMEVVQGDNGEEKDSPTMFREKPSDDPEDTRPVNEEWQELTPELAKQAYCNQSVWRRILISIAGPAMNIILGILLMLVMVLVQGENAAATTVVAGFHVQYTAEEAQYGFEPNDHLYSVNGKRLLSYAEFEGLVKEAGGKEITVTVQRLNEEGTNYDMIDIPVILGEGDLKLFTGSLSNGCGLMIEDEIIKVNSTRVHTYDELSYEIMNQGYKPLKLTILRNGEKLVLEDVVVPSREDQGIVFGELDFLIYREPEFNFVTVLKHTWFRSLSTVKMVYDSLFGLFSGRYGVEAVSGPVGITKVVGQAAKYGFVPVLNLIVIISINLGVMNLLPIPALDGGHIFIYLIEVVRRKPMKRELEGIINMVGLVLMLALAVLVAIKDIIAL
ncbi:MAG: RIP metalloprotease RseP [Ruminococcaceae bacterium]|nr:RIP metalloprotease RseP [Oscillospiraceae bacterium]